MIWFTFALTSAVIVVTASRLAHAGDIIALRTGLGRMFVGTMLLALGTSLPELLTMFSALNEGSPSLAVGSLFGSCMFNMALLAIVDVAHRGSHVLRRVALTHAVSAGLATLSLAAAVFFIQADIDISVGWVGVDSMVLIAIYLVGAWLIRYGTVLPATTAAATRSGPPSEESLEGVPSLRFGVLEFVVAAGVLVVVTPYMVRSAVGIAEATGLSAGFVGAALVAVVTSLPEAVTSFSAVRIRAYDLAVGNLFGSNIFNIFALGLIDLAYLDGRLLGHVDPVMGLAGLIALILTALALVGNVARIERRIFGVEIDSMLLIVVYALGMWLLYSRGLVA